MAVGVLIGFGLLAVPLTSTEGKSGVPFEFVLFAFVVVAVHSSFGWVLLRAVREQDPRWRTGLSRYYAACCSVAVVGIPASLTWNGVHLIMTVLLISGIVVFAATAIFVLRRWDRIEAARSDAAMFLGAGHMLALLGAVATAIGFAGNQLDMVGQQVLVGAVFGCTVLGLPASAGLWCRLAILAGPRPAPRRPEAEFWRSLMSGGRLALLALSLGLISVGMPGDSTS